jgi:hypothetical protein
MNLINRASSGLTLAVALALSAGCNGNTALVGRDALPDRASEPVQDELVGTVERIDTWSREIHLRPNRGRPAVVSYDAETRVMYRGREYPVTQLESGDVVAMQLGKDSRGNSYTHLIRVQERIRDRDQSRGDTARPEPGSRLSMGGWSRWTFSGAPSKCTICLEKDSSFAFQSYER